LFLRQVAGHNQLLVNEWPNALRKEAEENYDKESDDYFDYYCA